jgi:hypothetical protein
VRYGVCEFAHGGEMTIPSKYYANDEWIEITGSQGILFINRCTGNVRGGPVLSHYDGTKMTHYDDIESDWGAGFVRSTANFIGAIRGEEPPLLSGPQAREILRFALAVQKAARTAREVDVDELESPFPIAHFWRRLRNSVSRALGGTRSVMGGLFASDQRVAARAEELTEALVRRFDPRANPGWSARVGIAIADTGVQFVFTISNNHAEVARASIPEDVEFRLDVDAGAWSAVLLGRKRIEAALIQGKLKFRGDAREGVRLRRSFGF